MGMVTRAEISKVKLVLPVFEAAAGDIDWPAELDQAMTAALGAGWAVLTLLGICSRESRFGILLDKNGRGDHGHGYGLMQIDDRSHPAFIATGKWRDAQASAEYAIKLLRDNFNTLGKFFELFGGDYALLWWGAVAAYNCGAGNVLKARRRGRHADYYTTGRDYSADVKKRAAYLEEALT